MSERFATGLVVGRFAPLHLGHELLIATARTTCDRVVVLSYTRNEPSGCPAPVRAQWLASRFPDLRRVVLQATGYVSADLDEPARAAARSLARAMPADDADPGEHRDFVARVCREALHARIDAVFTGDDDGDAWAAAWTTSCRAREPSHPPIRHVLVDGAHTRVPISARQVRADVHACRSYLSPSVYAHFVERVCLLGGESSGKTTLARSLAQRFQTTWVREYGRALWERRGGALQPEDMVRIAETQVRLEDEAAPRARRFLFCDTSPLTTLFYSDRLFGRVDRRVLDLAARPYHHVVMCAPDFPFVQDGTRQGREARERQHAWYARELELRGLEHFEATGGRDERVRAVASWLRSRSTDPRRA